MENEDQRTNQIIKERYEQLPTELKDFFDYDLIKNVVNEIGEEFELTTKQTSTLENEVSIVMLLFLPKTGFTERITESVELDPVIAGLITDKIDENLFSLVENILIEAEEAMSNNEEGVNTPETNESEEVEETIEKISPIHTFSDDLKNVHGYGVFTNNKRAEEEPVIQSSQETALGQKENEPEDQSTRDT